MPFNRPSLADLVAEAESNVASRLKGGDSRLRRAALSVLARVQAGLAHGLYGFIHWVFLQVLPHTADEKYLHRHARNVRRKGAAYAKGKAQAKGVAGALIPAATRLKRGDGFEYETIIDTKIALNGLALLEIKALTDGAASNAILGTSLSLVSPVMGVEGSLSVAGEAITGGVDDETLESWRARILERWQKPPRGGSKTDFEAWAKEVPGVTRAWCYPEWMGLGTVGVVIVNDNKSTESGESGESGGPVPDEITINRAQAYLSASNRRPVTCHDVYVIAPTLKPLNVTISGLNPGSQEVKFAVEAEIRDLLVREGEPGVLLLISHIRAAISTAAGEWDHTLIEPIYNVAHRPHEMPVLGTITWE